MTKKKVHYDQNRDFETIKLACGLLYQINRRFEFTNDVTDFIKNVHEFQYPGGVYKTKITFCQKCINSRIFKKHILDFELKFEGSDEQWYKYLSEE